MKIINEKFYLWKIKYTEHPVQYVIVWVENDGQIRCRVCRDLEIKGVKFSMNHSAIFNFWLKVDINELVGNLILYSFCNERFLATIGISR